MLERDIEREACAQAKALGWLVYKFTSPNRRSVPDRMFIKDGRVVFIEFKRPGGRLTEAQARELVRLRLAGVETGVADSVELAMELLGCPPS
jgi:hypothetical protein